MSPLTLTNYTFFGVRPRIISVWITHSQDLHRIGEHKLFALPGQSITLEQNERGHIDGWVETPRAFELGQEHMNLETPGARSMQVTLRAFSRGQIRDIKKRSRTIEELGIVPVPITKEKRG